MHGQNTKVLHIMWNPLCLGQRMDFNKRIKMSLRGYCHRISSIY